MSVEVTDKKCVYLLGMVMVYGGACDVKNII